MSIFLILWKNITVFLSLLFFSVLVMYVSMERLYVAKFVAAVLRCLQDRCTEKSAKFTKKHQCWSHFLKKSPEKKDPSTGVFL